MDHLSVQDYEKILKEFRGWIENQKDLPQNIGNRWFTR